MAKRRRNKACEINSGGGQPISHHSALL
jgi:hypothetical protein